MNKKYFSPVIILIVLFIMVGQTAYIVNETEQVVITQFGKPVREAITEPGLYFKIPFIQINNVFDKRFLEWDGDPNQIPTKDKRFIKVDIYARWQINNALLFFQRVRNEQGAQSRLDDILDGETRNEVASHDIVELVRTRNRVSIPSEELEGTEELELDEILIGREQITRNILRKASPRTLELGIELLDLRIKRINYVDEVQEKIFERMISERKRIAEKFLSEGNGEALKIIGEKERDLREIRSIAYKTSEEIKGKADAEAASIYTQAYNKSTKSVEFYEFIKTLETYENTISDKDWLILSTQGEFYKFLNTRNN
ncbi:MAG: protease modulator HflC [Spirochaetales bacterium]|nr:protease modulator HflC [Spirochaetales bacterium]